SRIAAGGIDNQVRVRNAETGELQLELSGHTSHIYDMTFSPDDAHIASVGHDQTIRIWNAETGEEEQTLRVGHGEIYCAAYNSTGTRLVSGCWDSSVDVWDVSTGQLLLRMTGHTLPVYGVAYSPDDARIVSGSFDQKIKIWDANSGQELRSLEGHTGIIYDVRFSNDGNQIFSAGADCTIRSWDSGSSDRTRTLRNFSHTVTGLAFSPDGKSIVGGGNRVRLCDVETGVELRVFEGAVSVYGVAWSPDGKTIAASGWDGELVGWNREGKRIWERPPHRSALMALAFSPDSSRIAVGSGDGLVLVVDAASGEELSRFRHGTGQVKGIAFSPDGRRIYAGSTDGNLTAWDAHTGSPLENFKQGGIAVYAMALSADGRRLVSAGSTPTINVWDTASGTEITSLTGHVIQVFALCISPDCTRLIASGSENSVEMWDLSGRESTLTLEGHTAPVVALAFSPSGEFVATGSRDKTLKLWDASETRDARGSLPAQASARSGPRWIDAADGECPPSAASASHTLVFLENRRSTEIRLYWCDDKRQRVDFGRVAPGYRHRLATYANHSWVITDSNGSDLGYLIAGQSTGTAVLSATGVVIERLGVGQPGRTESSALETMNRSLEREPGNADLMTSRALWFGARGRWDEATADLQKAVELEPEEFLSGCLLSPLLAFQNNNTAYADHCRYLLQTWKPTQDPRTCERIAKACLLHPEVVDQAAVDALVKQALTIGEDYVYYQYFLMLKGLNALRHQDFAAAIEACEQSRSLDPDELFATLAAANHAVEAAAHHSLQQPEEAQKSLAAAKNLFNTQLPVPGTPKSDHWPDWLIARILYNEAAAAIGRE
ncbi:MAG: PQQ-binding-like beta-propeller repeat protein, partial [Planctomycetaceae bacterium]|nr:PQQ-binding-like beta-propeller repeat protein [Planctomycetaceae bacterium]